MTLKDDLEEKVKSIFSEQWATRKGQVVPSYDNLALNNDAVKLDGVVLYADMSKSTQLVDSYSHPFAAEIYKAYLHCAAKIIRSEGGEITAYDGDRIMAVFIGDSKNSSAVRTALKINHARVKIINPAIKTQYPETTYEVKHTVGVDSCELFIARTGIRGSNDLVWIGKAANHAAKLCELSSDYPSRITDNVYAMLDNNMKYANKQSIWEQCTWTAMSRTIYRSHWVLSF